MGRHTHFVVDAHVIILTGASGGIGRSILPSLRLLDEEVVAVYNSSLPDDSVSGIEHRKVNLLNEEEVRAFVSGLAGRLRRVTVIHAAAVSRDRLAAQFAIGDWDHIVDVNLRGDFLLTRELLMPMIRDKWGRIIHLSSVAGLRGVPGTLAYSTTKAGLIGMSRVLAKEYARFGVTSNVLVLGYFSTGLIETLSEKARKKVLDSIPSGKLGDPANVVNAVEFLIKSDYVSGTEIAIDGAI